MNQHPFQYGHGPLPNQPPPFPPYQAPPSGYGALPAQYALPAAGPMAFPSPSQGQQPDSGGMIPGLGLAHGLTGAQGQGHGQASGQGVNQVSWNGLVGQMARWLPHTASTQTPTQPSAPFPASDASRPYSRNTTVARRSEAIAMPTNVTNSNSNPKSQAVQPADDAMEEGELSDPNFDDLYEPDEPVEPAAPVNPPQKEAPPPAPLRPVDNTSAAQANRAQANTASVWDKVAPLSAPSAFQMFAASRVQNLQQLQHLPPQYPPPQQPLQPQPYSQPPLQPQQYSQPPPQQYSLPQQHPQLQQQHQQPQLARDQHISNGEAQHTRPSSYSPRLSSPRKTNMAPANDRKSKKAARKKAKKRQGLLETPRISDRDKSRAGNTKAAPVPATQPSRPFATSAAVSSGSASLVEARRNAQAAVLNLLPLQVTVQTFVDEGIDETVVRRVFSQLGIDPNASISGKSNAEAVVPPATVPPPLAPKSQLPASSMQNKAVAKPAMPAPVVTPPAARPVKAAPVAVKAPTTPAKPVVVMDKSGEERKDRIARLLAAKASKGGATPTLASAPSPTTPATPSLPASTAAATASITSPTGMAPVAKQIAGSKPWPDISKAPSGPRQAFAPQSTTVGVPGGPATITRPSPIAPPTAPKAASPAHAPVSKLTINKSDLLQQKLEALKKKREAEKKNPPALETPAVTPTPPVPAYGHPFGNASFSASSDGPTMQLSPSEDATRNLRSASTGGTVSSPLVPSQSQNSVGLNIPGLFTPVAGPTPLRPSRKRPVAADFVSDSPPAPAKRPLIYQRDDKPLIIDVSDESDSEDIEMDLVSPADENAAIRRPSSLRDLAPLSGGARPLPSPSPAGTAPNPQLALMNKQIEEMKRKIALAEARKKSKQPSGSVSVAATSNRSSKSPSASMIVGAAEDPTMLGVDRIPLRRAHTMTAAPPPSLLVVPDGRTMTPENGEQRQSLRPANEFLPVVEASLNKKRSRLEQLRLEIAMLEDEVDEDTKEQERLNKLAMDHVDSEIAQEGEPSAPATIAAGAAPPQQQPTPSDAGQSLDPIASLIADSIANTNGLGPVGAATQVAVKQSIESSSSIGDLPPPRARSGSPSPPKLAKPPSPKDAPPKDVGAPAAIQQDVLVATEHGDGPADIAMAEAVGAMESRSSPATRQSPPPGPADAETPAEKDEPSSGLVSEDASDDASDDGADQEGDTTMDAANAEQDEDLDQHANPQEATGPEADHRAQVPTPISDQTPQSEADTQPSPSFVPYESPLRHFRSFRYHPEYKKNVPGGLRSLTYSNKIDVDRALCSQELLEGACADRANCLYQHFDSMRMADDQILLQLGNNNEPFSGDEQVRYINGLRQLLASLRVSEAKDFDAITQAIIDYRAKFRGNPTRILPLGHVDL